MLACHSSYFHRALNPKKLIDIGFASVPSRLTYSSYIRFLSLRQVTLPSSHHP